MDEEVLFFVPLRTFTICFQPMESHSNIVCAFESQAGLNPEKTAVIFRGKQYSFRAVNSKANQLAHYLIEAGLRDVQIGISLSRSENIIISILGVLKAGCTYIFLDPQYPGERTRYILQTSDIRLLISSDLSMLSTGGSPVKIIKPDGKPLTKYSTGNPGITISSDSNAYIMYTSGSTGKPKGSVISHSNVIHYIDAINKVVNATGKDRYLHTASFSFSSSVRQYLLPLLNGITLVIADERSGQSLIKLLQLIKDNGVTIMDIQSLWKYGVVQLERLPETEKNALVNTGLRLVIFSGELLPGQLISHIKSLFFSHTPSFINLYGQTETIGGVAYPLPPDFTIDRGSVPVGYPLVNTTVHILDQSMKPAAGGEYGEIYISGPSVGKEYYKNPLQTGKFFIRNQGEGETDVRLFRTGDIARINEENIIEITGRSDFQVKIRGIRIETAEIEETLNNHPGVEESIVVSFEDENQETKLAAFIVKRSAGQLQVTEMKDYLRNILPGAFIPEKIMKIDKIPLNPNGKTDRKTLRSIAAMSHADKDQSIFTMHENEIQNTIHILFSQLLDIQSFHHTESFFDLGGHSLKAVELAEMMEQIFNKKISVDLVYRYSSVKQLASAVERIKPKAVPTNLVCIKPGGYLPPFFCVHGDDANFFLPRFLGNDIPYYGFFHQGQNGEKILHTGISAIAGKYIAELVKEKPSGPYILGGYSIGGVIAYEMANLLISQGQEVALLLLIDSLCPGYHRKEKPGRHVFKKTENTPPEKDFLTSPVRPMTQIKQKIQEKWFKIAYYPCVLLTMLNIKVPLSFRTSYIMGVYRRARRQYRPSTCIPCKAVLFRSTVNNYDDYYLGWEPYFKDPLQVYEIDADHHTIIREPQVRTLAELISKTIASHFAKS
jgi:amino acid adenylation domain-containing protein